VRPDHTVFASSEDLMGTHVSINVYIGPDGDAAAAGEAIQAGFNEMARIEAIASEWRPESPLSKLNAAAGGDFTEVPSELVELLQRSIEVSRRTQGKFDVTFHGVGKLWKFAPGATPPTDEAIREALPLVDWTQIEVKPETNEARLAKSQMHVGLGAIAKGYAVDKASAILRERGFDNHIVEAGGDTYVSGTKGGKPWRVGVQNPDQRGAGLGTIPASNEAIVTSGNYERYFEHEGKQYTHILDPSTGWPIPRESSPRSVTCVAGNATDADAYCTAVMVMGAAAGMQLVESVEGLDALIINADDAITLSSGLRERYQPRPK
jgi:thiamine biosynthesis lipoprotein